MFCSYEVIDQTGIDQINQINKLIYQLAKNEIISEASVFHDYGFLKEWLDTEFLTVPQIGLLFTLV